MRVHTYKTVGANDESGVGKKNKFGDHYYNRCDHLFYKHRAAISSNFFWYRPGDYRRTSCVPVYILCTLPARGIFRHTHLEHDSTINDRETKNSNRRYSSIYCRVRGNRWISKST